MKLLNNLAVLTLLCGSGLFSLSAQAADCGKIVIADMNWASASFIAYTDKTILETGMGCEVEIIPGDTMPTGTSMTEKGEPDVAPELWINAPKVALDAAVAEGSTGHTLGNPCLTEGEEGFWVPKYMVDKNPELATIEGVLSHPELFP